MITIKDSTLRDAVKSYIYSLGYTSSSFDSSGFLYENSFKRYFNKHFTYISITDRFREIYFNTTEQNQAKVMEPAEKIDQRFENLKIEIQIN